MLIIIDILFFIFCLSFFILGVHASVKTQKLIKENKHLKNENSSLSYELHRLKTPEPSSPEEWSAAVVSDVKRRQSSSNLEF